MLLEPSVAPATVKARAELTAFTPIEACPVMGTSPVIPPLNPTAPENVPPAVLLTMSAVVNDLNA